MVIGHYDCGVQNVDPKSMIEKMLLRGVTHEDLERIEHSDVNIDEWLKGFEDPADSVRETLEIIKTHPLIPGDVDCSGYLMDPVTGRIDVLEE